MLELVAVERAIVVEPRERVVSPSPSLALDTRAVRPICRKPKRTFSTKSDE